MNRTVLIILAGGFCTALLVAMFVQMLISDFSGNDEATEVATIETSYILVADKDMSVGAVVEDGDVRWQEWPENLLFDGAIIKASIEDEGDEETFSGRMIREVSEGEPLRRDYLIDQKDGNFVAGQLNKGERAVAINVKAATAVGGFVTPGDKVDVLLTYEVKLPSDEAIRTAAKSVVSKLSVQTVLENVKVLAIDQKTDSGGEAEIARTVTLQVDRVGAEKLALAEAMGALSLALRGVGDDEIVVDETASVGDTTETVTDIKISKVMQKVIGNENNTGIRAPIVRIYNGSSVDEVSVRPYINP